LIRDAELSRRLRAQFENLVERGDFVRLTLP
jgi:hypothetical protein